jgi:outer membrane protein TolC
MNITHLLPRLLFCLSILHFWVCPAFPADQRPNEIFTLEQTIESAVKANLSLKSSQEDIKAATAAKKARQTYFLPTFSATYQYTRRDQEIAFNNAPFSVEDEYAFVSSFKQPIFTGFSLLRQYDISRLGLDVATINENLTRQDIILEAKRAYFLLLKAQKLLNIAKETVVQINAQREVAENFYQVGMSPLNDLLQAQVELANAEQEMIIEKNNLQNAESNFNTLLRRPIAAPVVIKDILDYTSFEKNFEYCLAEAEKNRPEIKIADLEIEIAEKEWQLAKKDYYPSINLEGNYFKRGTDWDVDGGPGIYDEDGWDVSAIATWDFWEWGRTSFGSKEKLSRLSQAQIRKKELIDNIHLEVQKAFLRTQEAEKAIITVAKAIEQAKENFRINEERYKEQMSTSTDVLDAQTLLSRTMTNYYSALYEFKISKAALYRAMGQEVIE